MRLWKHLLTHCISLVFLVPAPVMFAIHEAYGLSDNIGGRSGPDDNAQLFNLAMVFVFLIGLSLFVAHPFHVSRKSGQDWHLIKLVFAFAYYLAVLVVFHERAGRH